MFRFEQTEKMYIIFGTFLLFFILPSVCALHTSTAKISPIETGSSLDIQFEVSVSKQLGDNINKFEILLPETNEEKPYYLVKEVGSPTGWTYEFKYKPGNLYPYKISWSTDRAGMYKDSTVFIFTATTPSELGTFDWMWKTVDTAGDVSINKFSTKTILIPFSGFELTLPRSTVAGNYFDITVTARDEEGNVKKDYTGTVTFTSSDPLAILPKAYTFTLLDKGSKTFRIKLKTSGTQTITVTGDGVSKTSEILVNLAKPTAIVITNSNPEVASGTSIKFDVIAIDAFGNVENVAGKTRWSIDKEAGGTWNGSVYTAEKVGKWTVAANYNYGGLTLFSGTTLTVKEEVVAPEKPKEEVPIEEKPEVVQEGKLEISSVDKIEVRPGEFTNLTLDVKNTGNINLTEVQISWSGVPYDWIAISPIISDIPVNKSTTYLAIVAVPLNQTGKRTITFEALSAENVGDSVKIELKIVSPSEGKTTGWFSKLVGTPTYLGLFIAGIIIILLIIWRLFLPKSKKRKAEE